MTESTPERFILRATTDKRGRTSHRRMINPEYIKWSLALENCVMITEPIRTSDWFDYKYNDKIYHMKFTYWENRYRPHLGELSHAMLVYDEILNNPDANKYGRAPDWWKKIHE